MSGNIEKIKPIVEAILFASDQPVSMSYLHSLLQTEDESIEREELREALVLLQQENESQHRGIELLELASGYQYRVRTEFSAWLGKLWQERPPRYSRALLETLALVIYRQPVTRAEIEEVRGVAVSSHIIRTLIEREWIKVIGYKDVPGKPALFVTTKQLLDYFNLKSLRDLPPLEALVNLDEAGEQLELSLKQEQTTAQLGDGSQVTDEEVFTSGLDETTDGVSIEHDQAVKTIAKEWR